MVQNATAEAAVLMEEGMVQQQAAKGRQDRLKETTSLKYVWSYIQPGASASEVESGS